MSDITEQGQILTELRKTIESKNAESSDAKVKLEKIEVDLMKIEEKNQELTKSLVEKENSEKEFLERFEFLEKQVNRKDVVNSEKDNSEMELKALAKFIENGEVSPFEAEKKYLRTDVDTAGGYLCPDDYRQEIIKKVTEISPIRSISRVLNTSLKAIEIPKRTAIPDGGYRKEGVAGADSQSVYGNVLIKTNRLDANINVSIEMLNDAAFDMTSEIRNDAAESLAQLEGKAFVDGDGIEKPYGFINTVSSTTLTAALTGDDILAITGEIKIPGYSPIFVFNRRTLVAIRSLKGTDDHYLFDYGNLAAGEPSTIAGERYVIVPDMPDITGSSVIPIVYGDFKKGYYIADRQGMTMIRDEYTKKKQGIVEFTFRVFNGGQQVLAEAMHGIKTQA